MKSYLITMVGWSGKTTQPWRAMAESREEAETQVLSRYRKTTGRDALGVHSVREPDIRQIGTAETPKSHKQKSRGKAGKGK